MANTLLAALTGAAEGVEQGIAAAMRKKALTQLAEQKRQEAEKQRQNDLMKLLLQQQSEQELLNRRLAGERENALAKTRMEALLGLAEKGAPEAGAQLDKLLGTEDALSKAAARELLRIQQEDALKRAREEREKMLAESEVGYKRALTAKAYSDAARERERARLEEKKLEKELAEMEGLTPKELLTLRGQIQDDINRWAVEVGTIDPKLRPEDYNRALQNLDDARRQRSAVDAKLGGPRLTPKKEGRHALANEAFKSARGRFAGKEIKPEQLARELNIYGIQPDPERPERTVEGAREYLAHREKIRQTLQKFAQQGLENIFKNKGTLELAITRLIEDNPDASPEEIEAAIRMSLAGRKR